MKITSNFEIECYPGKLKVVKELITFKFYDINKVYSGNVYKADETYLYETVGLPNGAKITFDVVGERIEVGTTSITLENIVILSEAGENITNNYSFEFIGQIIVRPLKITIQTGSESKQYDETPLSNNEYWISMGRLVNGHNINCTIKTTIIEIGSVPNKVDSTVILDRLGNDVTNNYEINYVEGTLTIR